MDLNQRAEYMEASHSLRTIANRYLKGSGHRTSDIHFARSAALHAADLIDNALDTETDASRVHGRGTEA